MARSSASRRRASTSNPRAVDDETKQTVVSMYQAGDKVADITAQTGLGQSSIYWILSKAGVEVSRIRKPAPRAQHLDDVVEILSQNQERMTSLLENIEATVNAWETRRSTYESLQQKLDETIRRCAQLERQNEQLLDTVQRLTAALGEWRA